MGKNKSHKRYVISRKNLPVKPPLWPTLIMVLFFKVIPPEDTAQWVSWGVIGFVFLVWWIGSLAALAIEEEMDVVQGLAAVASRIVKHGLGREAEKTHHDIINGKAKRDD